MISDGFLSLLGGLAWMRGGGNEGRADRASQHTGLLGFFSEDSTASV